MVQELTVIRTHVCALLLAGATSAVAQPVLTPNSDSLHLGSVRVGQPIASTQLFVKNTGSGLLTISAAASSNFALKLGPALAVIAPGDSFQVTMTWRPRKAGLDTASVTFTSNSSTVPRPVRVTAFGDVVLDPSTIVYRADRLGDVTARREGVMNGNLISTLFYNHGEVAKWNFQPSVVWPKGTNHSYMDGVAVLIGARTIAPGNGNIISPILSAYREEVDRDPVTGMEWVLQPVPGYDNPSRRPTPTPAVNRDTSTFPRFWPSALGLDPSWNGHWYGYFGRGVTNSDLETFFVMDDSKDREFTRPPFLYYPVAGDSARGGLGFRVEVRGFQWSHVLAEDIIFWHYDIVNISDWDYDSTCFGFYTDPGVGGPSASGNSARYNSLLDLAYAWNTSGMGVPDNWKTGYVGYAYLESPGNALNGLDDDEDGMIDERRDDLLDNDNDWVSFTDLNASGTWDPGEPLNDDLGRDGVGPTDLQYSGPDPGEGDGVPTTGEPNFDQTDKDESDQIGLSSAAIWALADKGPSGGWPKNDEIIWQKMNSGFRDTAIANTNISMTFSSGPFPLRQGRRERFSMALALGENLDDLIFNKETVQEIYNANYNFSKPPFTPRLTAVPGNGRVFLYWDNTAERSVDRFMGLQDPSDPSKGYKRDFEGYLLYRSTEAEFNDIKIITDSKGSGKYWKPIAQWDIVDSIAGPDPVGINGASFWRGSNTGLVHSYIDTTVLNGVRYYYALVSYDTGDPNRGTKGLQPTECTKIITEDFAGSLKFIDINCAVVTPNGPAAGYQPPTAEGDLQRVTSGLGTGSLGLIILDPSQVIDGARYTVRFKADSTVPAYRTRSYDLFRTTGTVTDTLYRGLDSANIGAGRFSPPFDGMVLSVANDTAVVLNDSATGWVVGRSNLFMRVARDMTVTSRAVAWPTDYEIKWFDHVVDTTALNAPASKYPLMPVNFTVTNLWTGGRSKFIVHDIDGSNTLSIGDTIRVLEQFVSPSNFKFTWKLTYGRPFGADTLYPQPDDRYLIKTLRPFLTGDEFQFTTRGSRTDLEGAKNGLDRIAVVPNPYIATASWERRTLYVTGRGERKIEFKNLPAQCTVRIYTVSGGLVATLRKNSSPMDGSLPWNLISDDGMEVAYGLYIYHVEAPGVGEHVGKFAIVK
jgi:hypothetical protein